MVFDAVVLAGGRSERLGGADKAVVDVGGRRLIDATLDAVRDARRVVVVGPERAVSHAVVWVHDRSPGAGPVDALRTGLELVASDIAVVLAVDMPLVERELIGRLVDTVGASDGAVCRDDRGRDQALLAAYRVSPLRARLTSMGETRNASMSALIGGLNVVRLDAGVAACDCDTWSDVARAEARIVGRSS